MNLQQIHTIDAEGNHKIKMFRCFKPSSKVLSLVRINLTSFINKLFSKSTVAYLMSPPGRVIDGHRWRDEMGRDNVNYDDII